jgi:hypothetical protein
MGFHVWAQREAMLLRVGRRAGEVALHPVEIDEESGRFERIESRRVCSHAGKFGVEAALGKPCVRISSGVLGKRALNDCLRFRLNPTQMRLVHKAFGVQFVHVLSA